MTTGIPITAMDTLIMDGRWGLAGVGAGAGGMADSVEALVDFMAVADSTGVEVFMVVADTGAGIGKSQLPTRPPPSRSLSGGASQFL
jgi:hypothetical protein